MTVRAKLRRILFDKDVAVAAGAHNALGALLVERAGFDVVWSSGFELSASRALPDVSLLSMSDYLEVSRQMSAATSLPVLADCDSGFGGAMNVAYLVLEYEAAGVAGVCIEDKAFPKMNSFVGGGQVLVPTEDFTTKIDSAVRARKDPDFVIVARTESYIAGCDTDEAIRRCEQYADAGADAILVHSRQSTPAEVFDFMAHWHRSVPVIAVPTTYHSLNLGQAQEAGLSLVIYANQGMRASIEAVLCTLRQIRSDGSAANVDDEIASLAEVFDLQGLDRWLALTDDSR